MITTLLRVKGSRHRMALLFKFFWNLPENVFQRHLLCKMNATRRSLCTKIIYYYNCITEMIFLQWNQLIWWFSWNVFFSKQINKAKNQRTYSKFFIQCFVRPRPVNSKMHKRDMGYIIKCLICIFSSIFSKKANKNDSFLTVFFLKLFVFPVNLKYVL